MTLVFDRCTYSYTRKAPPVLDRFGAELAAGCTVLLGPNGAGKSTLLGIASSYRSPDAGSVTWNGRSPTGRRSRASYRRVVGWLPQDVTPIPGLTVREQAAYVGWLKGMNRSDAWRKSRGALARVDLSSLAQRKSHQLSGGQLRRLGIAGALVHGAELLLLDEPTAGLDPSQRQVFRDLLHSLRGQVAVVVSTHQTEDLDELYDEVVVLDSGQVRYQGNVPGFLWHADPQAVAGRRAESAYLSMIRREV
ncbi:ATP-binding cassette domain-containing protein [Streptomyces durbertensis]|uniref:ATP-binding cassette domain-containing protein n=1 Tax=Streptomyces durbertensis TaxID=2448886 RepID=A0ABR6EJF7_9ACTN|nr:ATP-binding cassette domain-containing protein [Streptomyces durbertensis]MBB1244634.1 ATP-binding cassette domain-containing protein [Streptomyces durbertensis]